jgi:hypothetical protein
MVKHNPTYATIIMRAMVLKKCAMAFMPWRWLRKVLNQEVNLL